MYIVACGGVTLIGPATVGDVPAHPPSAPKAANARIASAGAMAGATAGTVAGAVARRDSFVDITSLSLSSGSR